VYRCFPRALESPPTEHAPAWQARSGVNSRAAVLELPGGVCTCGGCHCTGAASGSQAGGPLLACSRSARSR